MDLTLFSTDKENVVLEFTEVEAHATSETELESLLFVFTQFLLFVNN